MNRTIESKLIERIVEILKSGIDYNLLDLIYKMLVTDATNSEV